MIPDLGGVVENLRLRLLLRFAGGKDDFFERFFLEGSPSDQLVQLFDIGAMMMIVVELQRSGRDMRLKGVFWIRKGGQFEGHDDTLHFSRGRRIAHGDVRRLINRPTRRWFPGAMQNPNKLHGQNVFFTGIDGGSLKSEFGAWRAL